MIRFAVVLIAAFLLLSLPPAETQTANTQGFWEELMATFPLGAGGTFIAVQNNETLIHQNFGMVDPESQQAVDNHTVFMGGTLGEIIIAALAMDLVEQGKLNLSKEIVDIIPDLPFDFTTLKRNITLNDLLAHRSGMETIVFGNWVESREGIVDLHEFMKKRLPRVIWEPGTVLSPSSANYALVALALENVTGREFREYAKDTFFGPAGMNNSGFDSDPPSGTVATGVTVHGGIVPQTWVNL
ncbi:MAG: class C beta-lactamase-related serine hydrolase, partial [Methanobacteriota archaeon]